jgi:hypothetical protein
VGGQISQSPNDTVFYETNVDDQGWNLLGNPTASTLNWDATGWTKTNLDNSIYVWDPAVNQFRVWNGVNGTLGTGLISPFQAFWVKANNLAPALSFTGDVLTTGGTFYGGTALKAAPPEPSPSAVNLRLEASGFRADILLSFLEDGRIGEDVRDAYRLEPLSDGWVEFFTLSSPGYTMPLVINNLPSGGPDCFDLPLFVGGQSLDAPIEGTYTMNWELPPDWPADWAISLNDHAQKKAVSMKKVNTYSFTLGNTKSTVPTQVLNPGNSVPALPPSVINPISMQSRLKSETQLPPFSIVIEKGKSDDDPVYFAPEPALLQNYPNPVAWQTTCRFTLPEPSDVTLKLFDIRGILVDVLAGGHFETGIHTVVWTRTSEKPGFYFLQMDAGGFKKTKKLVITSK